MAINLTRHWLQAAQTLLSKTAATRSNPWDDEYPDELAKVVWNAVRAFRNGYFVFAAEIRQERAAMKVATPKVKRRPRKRKP